MTDVDSSGGVFSHAICEAVPDALLLVDTDGHIRDANRRVTEQFGYEPDEVVGEPIEILVPEDLRDAHVAQRDAYISDPETRPMGIGLDLIGQRKNGSTFPVYVGLSPTEFDGEKAIIATVRDTTERDALQTKYRALLETAPDAFFVADADTGELIEVNDRAVELMGYSEDELVGMHQSDLHPSGDADRSRELFEAHVNEGGIRSRLPDGSPIYIETSDGDHVPVEISAKVFELGDQRLVTGTFRDVSALRERERELERQNDRLDEFASVVSHDLQNPLNVATGRLELAQQDVVNDHLEAVESAHQRMKELIDDTLTLAREGETVGETTSVDVEWLVNACWQNVETNGATLNTDSLPTVQADASRLQHLFENLFGNAIDHGGTDVTIEVGGLDTGVYVEDDGSGIPVPERDAVFQPGYSTSADGTGLGLTIAKRIVEAHGWAIRLTDGDSGGTRFEITGVETSSDNRSEEGV